MKTPLSMMLILIGLSATANASLYEERARAVQNNENARALAKINRDYDKIQERFMVNLARFAQTYPLASTPSCTDRNGFDRSSWSWKSTRQVCGAGLCVNVLGDGEVDRNDTYAISLSVHRSYEMISACDVVLRNGLACKVSYIHSPKDAWMTHFGGTCIDANGRTRELKVPFMNIKFD